MCPRASLLAAASSFLVALSASAQSPTTEPSLYTDALLRGVTQPVLASDWVQPLTTQVAADQPSTRPAAPASPADAVLAAATPSDAVEAYARGTSQLAPDSKDRIALEAAFVRRMIDLDVPELAEAQARDLTVRDAGNAQAWAVLAATSAQRGNSDAALGQIQTAARLNGDDPFVQLTAGQLLAWYDTHPDAPKPPKMILDDIVFLREQMTNRTAYSRAYVEARDAFLAEPAPGEAPPSTASSSPSTRPFDESIAGLTLPPPPVVFYSEPEYYDPLYLPSYSSCAVVPGYYYSPFRYGYFHGTYPCYGSRLFVGSTLSSRLNCFPHTFGSFNTFRFSRRSPFFSSSPHTISASGGAIFRSGGSRSTITAGSGGGRFHDFRGGSRMTVSPTFVGPTRMPRMSAPSAAAAAPAPRSMGSARGGGGGGGGLRASSGGSGGGGGGAGGRGR